MRRLCFDHPERVAAFLCLGPYPYLRFKPQSTRWTTFGSGPGASHSEAAVWRR